jgi:hypothetical protein
MKTHFDVPRCFETKAKFQAWKDSAHHKDLESEPATICDDCTPAYRAEMNAAGRCEQPEWSLVRFGYKAIRRDKAEQRKVA